MPSQTPGDQHRLLAVGIEAINPFRRHQRGAQHAGGQAPGIALAMQGLRQTLDPGDDLVTPRLEGRPGIRRQLRGRHQIATADRSPARRGEIAFLRFGLGALPAGRNRLGQQGRVRLGQPAADQRVQPFVGLVDQPAIPAQLTQVGIGR